MNIQIDQINIYILVFVRIASMLLFNPIFSRRNIPNQIRMLLVMILTVVVVPLISVETPVFGIDLKFFVMMMTQVLIGYILGFVFQIFYSMLFFAGELLDIFFGMSMAKIFDPGTNIQMSMSGTFLNILFMLYIFVTDSHLTIIKIFIQSFQFIPIDGGISVGTMSVFIMNLFIAAFTLAIKMTLPFAVVEFVIEISMGILMKIIPQIHVFVINIQLKLFVGLLLLLVFSNPLAEFIDKYIELLLDNLQKVLLQ